MKCSNLFGNSTLYMTSTSVSSKYFFISLNFYGMKFMIYRLNIDLLLTIKIVFISSFIRFIGFIMSDLTAMPWGNPSQYVYSHCLYEVLLQYPFCQCTKTVLYTRISVKYVKVKHIRILLLKHKTHNTQVSTDVSLGTSGKI
jgi:hypothetical protein